MKPPTPSPWLASLIALAAASDSPSAQSTAPRATESVVELSPFVVNSSKDTGYRASSTMAGTRLNTDVKDIGASISIYTKEFIEDIGATSPNELLIYAAGMEAGGPAGNIGDTLGEFAEVNRTSASPREVRENPQGVTRSRGLAPLTRTRNFFNTLIDIDSYNTDRMTVIRGPNSALIGVGNAGGVIDISLAQPDLRRNLNKVEVRLDDNQGLRTTTDLNRVLIPDKLAARLVGLQSREEFDQRPAYRRQERLFGTAGYRPFASTFVRANFETGNSKGNTPINILPNASWTNEWFNLGRQGFDWRFYDDPARNPLAASQSAANFQPYYMASWAGQGARQFYAIYNNSDDQRPSSIIQGVVPSTTGTVANALRAQLLHPSLNRDLATDATNFTHTRSVRELPAGVYWTGGNVLPGNLPGFAPPVVKDQAFLDFNAFDWKNRMFDESSFFTQNFHSFNFSLAQHAWQNRVGIELASDKQRQDRRATATFINGNGNGNTQVRIDTTVTMPDGQPNPNLGRPSIASVNTTYTERDTDDETRRATVYLNYDFKDLNDSWGRWLGRHTLSGVAERFRRDTLFPTSRLYFDGPGVRDGNRITTRPVVFLTYLGPSVIGNNNPVRLNPIKLPNLYRTGPYGEISTFVRAAGTTDPGSFQNSPVSLVSLVQSGTAAREVIKSEAATLQSKWLQDHVVTVLGWRRDTSHYANQTFGIEQNPPSDPNDPGKPVWGFNDFNFPHLPPERGGGDNRSYSVVANWPNRLIRLPHGIDFSVFYNQSENFSPSDLSATSIGGSTRTDNFGRPIPAPEGTTKEYGFNLSAFNQKLVLRGNWFKTAGKNADFVGTASNGTVPLVMTAVTNWAVEGNTNPHLVASRNADIAKLLAPLPANIAQLYGLQILGTAPNITATHNNRPPFGRTDTADFVAQGLELEVVYNPTPNWRILANVAKQETIKTNITPGHREFAALMKGVVAELGNRPYGTYPTGYQLGQPLPANVQTLAQRVDAALTVPLASDLLQEGFPSPEQRKWRFNLVTNYTFGRGSLFGEKLKGWSIGGGLRWQDKYTMGYPATRLANSVPVFDVTNPWFAPAETNVDMFVSYTRKIWDNRVDWRLRLHGTNIYQERDLIPITVQPWGQPAAVRLAPEQRWYLTNTFSL